MSVMLQDFVARLVADSAVNALVSTRIRLNRSEQTDALPRVVVYQICGRGDPAGDRRVPRGARQWRHVGIILSSGQLRD